MKKIYAVALVLISMMLFTACGGDKWQENYDLGMRYLSEGNYAEAIIAFDKAIKIDPKQPMAYVGRADAHIASGETDDNLAVAFADYTAAIELDETNANAWLGLADVYIRQGEFDKAMETLQEALEKTNNADIIADKLAEIEAGNIVDSSGNIRRMNGYDENGNLAWYHIYSYDEKGRQSEVTAYNSQNQQIGHVDINYDEEDRSLVTYYYMSDTGEIVKGNNIYNDKGKVAKIIWDDGSVEMNEYDANGNCIKIMHYYKDQLEGYDVIDYIDGRSEKMTFYSAQGECQGYVVYEYDEHGNCIKGYEYNADGTLSWYWTSSYDENGKKISEQDYDGDGTLRASTASE